MSDQVETIPHKLLLSMQQTLILTGIKGSTVHRRMGIIKAATHWAHLNGFIENMPIFPPSPKSVPNRYVPPIQEEISRIYQVASPHLRRAIILGFMFGLRIGPCELLKLTWDDIDLQQMVIRVPNANKGVSELWREVPMTANMVSLFTSWQKEDKRLGQRYVIHYKGKPVKNIRTGWIGALKRAGISRHIRPYDLRHGFATQAIESGADYGTVAELMGHRSPMMVLRHYQHVNNAQKKRVMDKITQPILAEKVV